MKKTYKPLKKVEGVVHNHEVKEDGSPVKVLGNIAERNEEEISRMKMAIGLMAQHAMKTMSLDECERLGAYL